MGAIGGKIQSNKGLGGGLGDELFLVIKKAPHFGYEVGDGFEAGVGLRHCQKAMTRPITPAVVRK